MTYQTELRLGVPSPKDLCCFSCQLNPADVDYSVIRSEFHCQTLTCRLLVHSERFCIATPSIDNSSTFHVIVNKRFYSSGLLQERLCSMKIKFSEPEYVRPEIYEACLKFTFTFKITPSWNLIGQAYYLHKSNFLSSLYNIDVVEWKVLVGVLEAKLKLKPLKMNLFPITFDFLGLPNNVVQNFKANSDDSLDTINLTLFHCPWVYVLPNLTKARVISVSKKLPPNSIFDSYKDFQLHWKYMYSYQLPKRESEMLFYEVVFPKHPNQRYIYPEMCLFSLKPEIFNHNGKNEICLKFIDDLQRCVQTVCGQELVIHPTLANATTREENTNEQDLIKIVSGHSTSLALRKAGPLARREKKVIADSQDFPVYTNDFKQKSWIITSTDDINSFYDIPSMHSCCQHSMNKSQNSDVEEDSRLSMNLNSTFDTVNVRPLKAIEVLPNQQKQETLQKSFQKPVITQVEDVFFDLPGIKKIRTINKCKRPIPLRGKRRNVRKPESQSSNENEKAQYYMPPSTFETIKKVQEDNHLIDYQMKPSSAMSSEFGQYLEKNLNRSRSPLSLDSLDFNKEHKKPSNEMESSDSSNNHNLLNDNAESCDFLQSLFDDFIPYDIESKDNNNDTANIDDQNLTCLLEQNKLTNLSENSLAHMPLSKTKLMSLSDNENENNFFSDDSLKLSPLDAFTDSKLQEEFNYSPDNYLTRHLT